MTITHLFNLTSKKVLITGGSQGIGLGIAKVFVQAGADVLIAARHRDKLDYAVDMLKQLSDSQVYGMTVDASNKDSCQELALYAQEIFGFLDVLCTNAGILPQSFLEDLSENELDRVIDTNLKGTIYSVQAVLHLLKKSAQGRIIITSSITGSITGYPGWSHYGASKAAQLGFMRTAAIELAPYNITVNAVLPGNILTEGLMEMGEDYISSMSASIPVGRLGTVEEIGYAVAFLASDEAKYITGQSLVVDGGQVLPESLGALNVP